MKYLLVVFSILLFSFCSNGGSTEVDNFSDIPKLKKEIRYNWDKSMVLETINFEYYNNGLLKHISKTYSYTYWEKEMFYNSNSKLSLEIIHNGELSTDTLKYEYNKQELLAQIETIHSESYFHYNDTIEYKYDEFDRLIETLDKRGNQRTILKSVYEYNGNLLVKKQDYIDDNFFRTFEYEYANGKKIKETIYRSHKVEYVYIFDYEDGLLSSIKGYFPNYSNIDSEEKFTYNFKKQLVSKKVQVSMISSYTNHIIYYEYW